MALIPLYMAYEVRMSRGRWMRISLGLRGINKRETRTGKINFSIGGTTTTTMIEMSYPLTRGGGKSIRDDILIE